MTNSDENIEAKLAAYVDGEATPAERAEIEKHLAGNPQQRALIEALRRDREALRGLPQAASPIDASEIISSQMERAALLGDVDIGISSTERPSSRWRQLAAIAAVLVVTATLATALYYALPSPKAPPPQVAIITPEVPKDTSARDDSETATSSSPSTAPGALEGASSDLKRPTAVENFARAGRAGLPTGGGGGAAAGGEAVLAASRSAGAGPNDALASASPVPTDGDANLSDKRANRAMAVSPRREMDSSERSRLDLQPGAVQEAEQALQLTADANDASKGGLRSSPGTTSNASLSRAGYVIVHATDPATATRVTAEYLRDNEIPYQQANALADTTESFRVTHAGTRLAKPEENSAVAISAVSNAAETSPLATVHGLSPGAAASTQPTAASSQPSANSDEVASTAERNTTTAPGAAVPGVASSSAAAAAMPTTGPTSQPGDAKQQQQQQQQLVIVARGLTQSQIAALADRVEAADATVEPIQTLTIQPDATNSPARVDMDKASKDLPLASNDRSSVPPQQQQQPQQQQAPTQQQQAQQSQLGSMKNAAAATPSTEPSAPNASQAPTASPSTQPAMDQTVPLQAGDTVRVQAKDVALGVVPFDESAVVDADGKITLPHLGAVTVAGSTPRQAADSLPHALPDDPVKAELAWSMARVPTVIPAPPPAPTTQLQQAQAADQPMDVVILFRKSPPESPATEPTTEPTTR